MVRFKQRYLLFNVVREGKCDGVSVSEILGALRRNMERVLGSWGYGALRASLSIKYWNPDTGMLIIRVARDHFRQGWFAVTSITEIKDRRCALTCMHVGGTIRVVKKTLLRYQLDRQRSKGL
jgi:ribonuclease P/MRP protein subunit POP5